MKIMVKAGGADRRVPMEPRRKVPAYFPQDDKGNGLPVTVERTAYIERRLACDDLVECDGSGNPVKKPDAPAPSTPPPAAKPSQPAAKES